MGVFDLHLIIILIGLLLVNHNYSVGLSPPMGTLEAQRDFLEPCFSACVNETSHFVDRLVSFDDSEITESLCRRECYEKRDNLINQECSVLYLGSSIAFCTSSSCSFAPVSLFPLRLESFTIYHYVLSLAYCVKADMDIGDVVGDLDDPGELAYYGISLEPHFSSRRESFKYLLGQLPDVFPKIEGSHILVGLFKTHPDVKIVIRSVARLYFRLNEYLHKINAVFKREHTRNDQRSIEVFLPHRFIYHLVPEPQLELYYYPHDCNLTDSQENSEGQGSLFNYNILGFLLDLYFPYLQFPVEGADIPPERPLKKVAHCYVSLWYDGTDTIEWLLKKGTQTGKHGYKLASQRLSENTNLFPPSMLYSREYLDDLCSTIKEYDLAKVISIDIEPHLYELSPVKFPPYFRLRKLSAAYEELIRVDLGPNQ